MEYNKGGCQEDKRSTISSPFILMLDAKWVQPMRSFSKDNLNEGKFGEFKLNTSLINSWLNIFLVNTQL